ncbi:hypothetical protein [Mesorhizobium sp. 113-3-9]|uniref:hypothetical protein n=1 Tax=Mesorhizobium sp. 113-3-9 TaxID=2744517 RepID=UPI001926EA43|nr:hypothetical protein [Mesorhizobium sp. 113-3-9]
MMRSFSSNSVAGFDVDQGQGEEQKPYPDNNDVHCASSLLPLFTSHLPDAGGQLRETARRTSSSDSVRRFPIGNMDPIAIKVRDGQGRKEIGIL